MVQICAICAILILMDVVCGVTAAARAKMLCSSVMREGLFNKVAELLLLLLAVICSNLLVIEPFCTMGIPPEVASVIAVYIAGMEILSIIENICKINPDLPFANILAMFHLPIDNTTEDSVDSKVATEK